MNLTLRFTDLTVEVHQPEVEVRLRFTNLTVEVTNLTVEVHEPENSGRDDEKRLNLVIAGLKLDRDRVRRADSS